MSVLWSVRGGGQRERDLEDGTVTCSLENGQEDDTLTQCKESDGLPRSVVDW